MVRTRIAPSPTGEDIHIGNLYTALINWAFAKKNSGKFIIRVEDTDQERKVAGSEEKILSTIKKFGLVYDEGPDIGGPFAPYRQSERLEIYNKYAKELISKKLAYYCYCSREKLEELKKKGETKRHSNYCDSKGEKYVIRLKVPENKEITFNDLIRGDITINTNQIDDQILIKSDGFPTYHMAVVIDDVLMEITHVIRAEEWISSTPKHILIYEALGFKLPIFVHLPILRNADKSKLSKRRNPVWASYYLKQGFLPEAVLNYLALMGWSFPEGKEIFSMDEFIKALDLKDIQVVGPSFDPVKLEWMNGEYIRKMSDEELTKRLQEFLVDSPAKEKIASVAPLIKERIKKLSDFVPLTDFLFEEAEYEISVFEKIYPGWKKILEQILTKLKSLPKPWKKEDFESTFQELAKQLSLSNTQMFQLIRVAISGQLVTPPLFESIQILGEGKTIERFEIALLN